MRKLFTCCVLFLLATGLASSQTRKTKTIVIDNKVLLVVPSSFRQQAVMAATTDSANNKWVLLNKQETIMIIYELGDSNDPNAVDIGDNDVQEWADKQLTALKKQPGFFYLDDGNFLQDGKNIGYIKYIGKQPASWDTFNLLFFTSVDNKLVQFSFICPAKMQKKWEPMADEIANSVRVTATETPDSFL